MAVIVAACVLASALIAGGVLLQARRDAVQAAEREAVNLASIAAADIGRTVSLYDLSLQAVARGMELRGLSDLPPDLRQMVLFDRAASAAQFGFLNVLDAAGDVVADRDPKLERHGNFAYRDYFQALRRDPQDLLYVARPVLTAPGQQPMVPVARRRFQPDGSFAGVVVGSMRLAPIQELFARIDLGRHGSAALMRTDGVVLMRLPFNPDDVGRTIPAGAPVFRFLEAGAPVLSAIDPDRVRRITAYHRVGELPLVLSIGLADTDVLAGWWTLAGGIVLAVAASAAAVFLLLRRAERMDRELLVAGTVARNAKAEQERVCTTVSHELRTPLMSLLAYVQMLSEAQLPPSASGCLAGLSAAGEHLKTVIDRQLEFTSGRGTAAFDPAPTQLDELINRCCKVVEPDALRRGLEVKPEIAPALPRVLKLDATNLRMVLGNLLSNAVKYTQLGSVTLRVGGSSRRIRFEVADTGPGIPPHKRNRLFQEFDRLDADRSVPGWGVGLSISRRLVEAMGGAIGHDENPGGGSVFWVEIPTSEATAREPAAESREEPEDRRLRILLVEDHAVHRDIATTWLEEAGHEVTTANSGAEGIHLLLAGEFDLIVTDMRMPAMTGLEMAQRIRDLAGPRSRLPILLLSGDMALTRHPGYESARISLVLPKPFLREQLLGAVRFVISGRKPVETAPESGDLFERTRLDELGLSLPAQDLDDHLETLAGRIEILIELLAHRTEETDPAFCDLAHDVGSAAGQLGFAALCAALRRFQVMPLEERLHETHLADIAVQSLERLRTELSRRSLATA